MLGGIVEYTVEPLVSDFSMEAQTLKTSTAEYCASIDESDEAIKLTAARDDWKKAMTTWQQLEIMQFGPLLTERDEFYSWPLNDSCKVDEEVVFSLVAGYDINDGVTPARRGLDAMEYLIFNENMGISCAQSNTTTALSNWGNKSDVEKRQDRCSYAEKVSSDLTSRAERLVQSYAGYELANDATSMQEATNLVSDALFYIDKKTKDAKLTELLPKSGSDTFKVNNLEFLYADINKDAVDNNLVGALALMDGTNGEAGIKDYLIAAGQADLATDMIARLNEVTSHSEEISQSYRDILTAAGADDVSNCINADAGTVAATATDLETLCSLDNKVKAFTDDLKSRFVLTLGFSTPKDAEGDND
jgi:predicted lipoprotein